MLLMEKVEHSMVNTVATFFMPLLLTAARFFESQNREGMLPHVYEHEKSDRPPVGGIRVQTDGIKR
ncbi:hypothetical protein SAMN05421736_101184 [Evansella caseinilytica]|uniref:Uncharacterized protein n=1 Tax=Evansella caseinilytica TaxID=1503961 RepID=A0A1H3GJF6_9BACI|nr:hypothetical protein SAMN05421736_101184 [Evansella caseinilytica]